MNSEITKSLRFLKYRNIEQVSNTEIAYLAGVNRKTIQRNKAEIQTYLLCAPVPTQSELLELDKKALTRLLELSLSSQGSSFKSVLHGLSAYILLYQTDLINNLSNSNKVLKIGQAFIEVSLKILALKNAEGGVSINSINDHLSYLKKTNKSQNLFKSLFNQKNSYQAGLRSKAYGLTFKAKRILVKLKHLLDENIQQYVSLINKHMCKPIPNNIKYATSIPHICLSSSGTSTHRPDREPAFMYLKIDDLTKLSLPSLLQVLNFTVMILNSVSLMVTLKNLSHTNSDLGRHYNIFTRLRSKERKALGYYNYDISGGIQIISFGILYHHPTDPDLFDRYPMLFKYGWDPAFKQNLRNIVSMNTGLDIDAVKRLLTAYANGKEESASDIPELKQFQKESDKLRREVLSKIAQYKPEILKMAIGQSRHTFSETLDWKSMETEKPVLARQKASVFFFVWTYFEKPIRDAMLSLVDDGIPVHDAIYSKHALPFRDFQKAIQDQTGFEVKISH